jgi:hypothetical protein
VLYIIMDLTQLERIKSELKRKRYEQNKIERIYSQLTIDFRE